MALQSLTREIDFQKEEHYEDFKHERGKREKALDSR